jgi:uncharacterized metal-binding protein YceD (DUF177 family)
LDKKSFKFTKIDAEVGLHRSSLGIRADFKVVYEGEFICARCLGKYARNCDVELYLDYVEGDDPYMRLENVELSAHDADKVFYRGPEIDLSVGMREAIILSQPITALCKDDCLGLCPVCGANLNKKRCACKIEKVGPFTVKPKKPKATTRKKSHKTKKK